MFMMSGSIHYEVEIPIIEATLDEMQQVCPVALNAGVRSELRQIGFGHTERTEMIRPELAAVMQVLGELIQLTTKRRVGPLVARLAQMAALHDHQRPADEHVYEALLHEMKVGFEPTWRENISSGRIDVGLVGMHLRRIRSRLRDGYAGLRGGSRQHELGYILPLLATVFRSIGGRITVRSHRLKKDGRWVLIPTPFMAFVQTFADRLPQLDGAYRVDVGPLIRTARREL
jgi:hypothetical protein